LVNDPGELYDLAAEPAYKNTLLQWRQRMIEHLSERGEQFVSDGELVIRKKTSAVFATLSEQKLNI
jgi:arylsulfatase